MTNKIRPVWVVLRAHWSEYLIEMWGLGTFMVSACLFATLIEHPQFPIRDAVPNALLRRVFMGLAMGLTAVGIIYSPWGRRSGAHLNPAVTLTFYRLGKLDGVDAAFYSLFQFVGGAAGVALAAWALPAVSHPTVRYVVTVPGEAGRMVALVAEAVISGGLMLGVLITSNHPRLTRDVPRPARMLPPARILAASRSRVECNLGATRESPGRARPATRSLRRVRRGPRAAPERWR
jgi:aquaporin Z